jgi:hypothetical protein
MEYAGVRELLEHSHFVPNTGVPASGGLPADVVAASKAQVPECYDFAVERQAVVFGETREKEQAEASDARDRRRALKAEAEMVVADAQVRVYSFSCIPNCSFSPLTSKLPPHTQAAKKAKEEEDEADEAVAAVAASEAAASATDDALESKRSAEGGGGGDDSSEGGRSGDSSPTDAERARILQQLKAVTCGDDAKCRVLLENNEWDIERAVAGFFSST